ERAAGPCPTDAGRVLGGRRAAAVRLLGQGAQPAVGLAPQAHPHQGIAQATGGLRQVLPVLTPFAVTPLAVLVFGVVVGRFAAEPTPRLTDVAVPTIHVETGRAYR